MLRKKSSKVICATLFLLFGKDLITLKRESSFQKAKMLRKDTHSREDVICRKRPRSVRECA